MNTSIDKIEKTQTKNISNVFLKLGVFTLSFFIEIIRSIKIFLWWKRENNSKKTKHIFWFFDFLIFDWPQYFSKKPSAYKVFRFFGDVLQFLFLKK